MSIALHLEKQSASLSLRHEEGTMPTGSLMPLQHAHCSSPTMNDMTITTHVNASLLPSLATILEQKWKRTSAFESLFLPLLSSTGEARVSLTKLHHQHTHSSSKRGHRTPAFSPKFWNCRRHICEYTKRVWQLKKNVD